MSPFRELKDELQRLLMRVIDMEQQDRERRTGKVNTPEGWPKRTFTGTFRGTQRELKQLPDDEGEG